MSHSTCIIIYMWHFNAFLDKIKKRKLKTKCYIMKFKSQNKITHYCAKAFRHLTCTIRKVCKFHVAAWQWSQTYNQSHKGSTDPTLKSCASVNWTWMNSYCFKVNGWLHHIYSRHYFRETSLLVSSEKVMHCIEHQTTSLLNLLQWN